jgi:hypothetical protein
LALAVPRGAGLVSASSLLAYWMGIHRMLWIR